MPKKFVPVMLTPFNAQAGIDYDVLEKLVDFYLASGVKGLFANCLSSEMYSLNAEERLALTKAIVDQVNGRVPVVATSSFGLTIEDKAEFTKKIYDTGIDAAVLITSHFVKVNESDDILLRNIEKIISLTGDIPLGLYECPVPYKRVLSAKMLKTLVDTNRMFYHKDTCCDEKLVSEKLEAVKGSKLQFFDAHTPNAVSSMKAGADGMSAIAGNFYPEVMCWLCENVDNPERQDDVKWLQEELRKADIPVHTAYPMSAKVFLQLRGLPIQAISRSHALEPTPAEVKGLEKLLQTMKMWCEKLDIKEKIYETVM